MSGVKKEFNEYKIEGNCVTIYLKKRTGEEFKTLIDLEDLERIKNLHLHWNCSYVKLFDGYYAMATEYLGIVDGKPKYKSHYLHKEVVYSEKGTKVDHIIPQNTLDNRKNNLRLVNTKQNATNRSGRNKNNSSGYRNVFWSNRDNKWLVQIQVNGKNANFGKFDYEDLDKAGLVAEEMRNKYYKEYAGNN